MVLSVSWQTKALLGYLKHRVAAPSLNSLVARGALAYAPFLVSSRLSPTVDCLIAPCIDMSCHYIILKYSIGKNFIEQTIIIAIIDHISPDSEVVFFRLLQGNVRNYIYYFYVAQDLHITKWIDRIN